MMANPAGTGVLARIAIDDCWQRIGVRGDRSCPKLEQHLHCRNCPTFEAAARDLLDRPLPPGYAEEWARHFAADEGHGDAAADDPAGQRAVVIFRLRDEWLALSTSVFQEVAEPRPIHSLPHRRDAVVLGIVNVRGELVVCLSLADLIGVGEARQAEPTGRFKVFRRLVVIGSDGRRVAFEVDEVYGIHRHAVSDEFAVPVTIGKASSSYASAMFAWQGHTVGCLDEARVLEMIDRSIA